MTSRIWKMAGMIVVAAALTAPAAAFSEEGCNSAIRKDAFGDLKAVIIPAADIAGNDGWMPLSEAMAMYGIDDSFKETVMNGGGEFTCLGKNDKGQTTVKNRLVGWFLDGNTEQISTVGHLIYGKDDKLRPEMPGCYLAMNGDVLAGDGFARNEINPDPRSYVFGGQNPAGSDRGHDRALIPLLNGKIAGATSIETRPDLAATLKIGDTVYMVSAARPFHRNLKGGLEPMMQKCLVIGVRATAPGHPNEVRTSCDSFKGVSGSLMFMPDPAAKGRLAAVGMQARAMEHITQDGTPIDGRPADEESNTAIVLAFDQNYKRYGFKSDTLVSEVNGTPTAVTTDGSK